MADAIASPAPATPATPSAAPSASPAPGSTPVTTPENASPASPSSPNDANIRQLREGYEAYKKLGDIDKLQPEIQGYRGAVEKVSELGRNLGYTAESVQAAFLADPVATIQALQKESQTRASNPQPPNNDPRSLVREEIAPIVQHVQRQMAEAANGKFDSEFGNILGAHPEFKDCPEDVRSAIYDMTSESFKHDEAAMQRLLQGKTSDIKKYVDGVTERFLKVMNGYSQWKQTKPPQTGTPVAQPAARPNISLDDIINGTAEAQKFMPTLRA